MALSLFGGGRGSDNIMDPFSLANTWSPFDLFPQMVPRSFAQDQSAIAGTRVDWVETPEAHVFRADLPGLTKNDIKVQLVDDRTLEISGERSKEEEKTDDRWHRVERSYGRFLRRFRLPDNAKVDEVSAKAENGVLTVTVPKAPKPEQQPAKSIDIK